MRALRQKLNSQRGASILIAMVFFLLCLTVGAVVLTAATANAGRLASRRQEEQNYLTVSSAARLLRDGLEGAKFEVVTTTVSSPEGGETTTGPVFTAPGLLDIFKAQAKEVFGSKTSATREFQIVASGSGTTFETVSASAVMDTDYHLVISVWLGTEEDKGNPMQIEVRADMDTIGSMEDSTNDAGDVISTTTTATTITWQSGEITKGAVK